jgi:hypothetical protein
MKKKRHHPPDESQTFYVDIPTEDCVDNDSGAWHNVGTFYTEAGALAFAEEHFGADARGRVFLVPSQMDQRRDRSEMAATDMVALLKASLPRFVFGNLQSIAEVDWLCRTRFGMA